MNPPGATLITGFRSLAIGAMLFASASMAVCEPASSSPRLSPLPTSGEDGPALRMPLDGTWKFHPNPPDGFGSGESLDGWVDIRVPGEWAMQGFDVPAGKAAGYQRTFRIPEDWAGRRIKLRCDAVYSDAEIRVNGKPVGRHSGGFTPFEIDITDAIKTGQENRIAMSIVNETDADKIASGSKYACHQLGGISRHIFLVALPQTNLSSLQVATRFDSTYTDANLDVNLAVEKPTAPTPGTVEARLRLTAPDGSNVPLAPERVDLSSGEGSLSIPVSRPAKWDSEHPNLYTLRIDLCREGKPVESVDQKVGFRQIEIRKNEMFVNGMPVKLRGVNHHEVYPTTGRSVPDGLDRRDVEIFREGNVNHLRTCHYPPDEALLNAADELGMFVECEAPLCWVQDDIYADLICRQTAEMAIAYRNHPSVLFWSLANESKWGKQFAQSSVLLHRLDPTRPQTFNDANSRIVPTFTQILNRHYPGFDGPKKAAQGLPAPLYHGEDAHLNSYNRLELATDPSLRDTWGRYLSELWEEIYKTPGALGQSIWAGIDDTFYMKDDQTVGYGTWGPIDGWRRFKPEWWNMKKAYAPVKILNRDRIAGSATPLELTIENRQNFSNLNEMKITWEAGGESGTVAADIPAHSTGTLKIPLHHTPKPGETLALTFRDPRGFVADEARLLLASAPPAPPRQPVPTTFSQTGDIATIRSGNSTWTLDLKSGQFVSAGDLKFSGPTLMILALNGTGETQMKEKTKVWKPFTDPCTRWHCDGASIRQDGGAVRITIPGGYAEATGTFDLTFENGQVAIGYDFQCIKPINPRQIGLVFSLPTDCESLAWKRVGYWDSYPDDHIARLEGTVKASEGFEATSVGPRTQPQHPWRLDRLPYGNNDFCSTKHQILQASLTNPGGQGIAIDGHGTQHLRCWRTDSAVSFLVADSSNGGGAPFLKFLARKDERPLKPGDKISGRIELIITSGLTLPN